MIMNKSLNALLVLSLIIFGVSCKKTKEKVDELTEFDMSYSYNLSVPSSSVNTSQTVPVDFVTSDISTNSSSTFSAQKTAADKVSEIKLTKFKISTPTAGANLDYLKSLSIYIQASGQPEVLLASKASIPTGVTSFDMDLSGTNLKEYLFGATFKLRVAVLVDVNISTAQTLKLDETMHVKATLLN